MQSSAPVSAGELIANGIVALRAGNKATSRAQLCEALRIDPDNDQAWLWLSGAVDIDAERRYCLERVLALNPAHQAARRGLEQLPASCASASPLPAAPPVPVAAPATLLELIAAPVGTASSIPTAAPAETDLPQQSGSPPAFVDEGQRLMSLLAAVPALTSYTSQPSVPSIPQSSTQAAATARQGTPTPKLDDQVVAFVVKRLGKHTARNDVIRELTEWRYLAWVDAERLVATVERKYVRRIAIRQAPFFFCLAIGVILGGAAGLLGSLFELYIALVHPSLRSPRLLVYGAGGVFTSLAMLGGGLMGIGQIFRAVVFNR
jgi:hypothetical protein